MRFAVSLDIHQAMTRTRVGLPTAVSLGIAQAMAEDRQPTDCLPTGLSLGISQATTRTEVVLPTALSLDVDQQKTERRVVVQVLTCCCKPRHASSTDTIEAYLLL